MENLPYHTEYYEYIAKVTQNFTKKDGFRLSDHFDLDSVAKTFSRLTGKNFNNMVQIISFIDPDEAVEVLNRMDEDKAINVLSRMQYYDILPIAETKRLSEMMQPIALSFYCLGYKENN